jgi:hypothetical protein
VEQLRVLGIPFHRKAAVHVDTLAEAMQDPTIFDVLHEIPSFMNKGLSWDHPQEQLPNKAKFVLSVFLSHLTLYKELLTKYQENTSDDILLVLEDDVVISANFSAVINMAVKFVPRDFDILRLGFWDHSRAEDAVNQFVFRSTQPFWDPMDNKMYYGGAHAVGLRISSLKKIVDTLQRMPLTDVDSMLSCYPTLMSYVLNQDTVGIVDVLKEFDEASNPSKRDLALEQQFKQFQNGAEQQPEAKVMIDDAISTSDWFFAPVLVRNRGSQQEEPQLSVDNVRQPQTQALPPSPSQEVHPQPQLL